MLGSRIVGAEVFGNRKKRESASKIFIDFD
jgi:hypothetical protein